MLSVSPIARKLANKALLLVVVENESVNRPSLPMMNSHVYFGEFIWGQFQSGDSIFQQQKTGLFPLGLKMIYCIIFTNK